MDRTDTNRALFNRAQASVLDNQRRFAEQDARATEAAARILEASRTLAERDPETYFGLVPSERDRFLVDTLERGAAVVARLDELAQPDNPLVRSEIDITGEAPRRPRTRAQRRRARGSSGGGFIEGAKELVELGERLVPLGGGLIDFIDGLGRIFGGGDKQPPVDDPPPTGAGSGGGTVPRETPGPGSSSRDFFIEEKRYVLEQLEKALEGLERTGSTQTDN